MVANDRAVPTGARRPGWRALGAQYLRMGGLLLSVAVLALVFQELTGGSFLIFANVLGIFRSTTTIAILAMGLLVVVIVAEIDLSFGSLYGLCANLMAVSWIIWGWPIWAAIALGFLVAMFVGAVNAFLVVVEKLPSFIATLGTATLIYGFTLLATNSISYDPSYPPPSHTVDPGQLAAFLSISNAPLPLGIPMQGVWLVITALIMWFLLSRSVFGFRLLAIGGNAEAARLAGLPVSRYKLAAFMICAVLACFAALLDFSFIGAAQPSLGQTIVFPTFSAVVIGGASLSGGRGTVLGALTGAILLAVILNGIAVLSAGPFAQQMLLGTVTIGAVLVDLTARRRTRTYV